MLVLKDVTHSSKSLKYWCGSCHTLPPGSKRPNLFYAVTKFADKYGSIFGFWINQVTFVVLTEYEDIKEVLKMEAIAGRVAGEPGNRNSKQIDVKRDLKIN